MIIILQLAVPPTNRNAVEAILPFHINLAIVEVHQLLPGLPVALNEAWNSSQIDTARA